jgi:hypothetical protein
MIRHCQRPKMTKFDAPEARRRFEAALHAGLSTPPAVHKNMAVKPRKMQRARKAKSSAPKSV